MTKKQLYKFDYENVTEEYNILRNDVFRVFDVLVKHFEDNEDSLQDLFLMNDLYLEKERSVVEAAFKAGFLKGVEVGTGL